MCVGRELCTAFAFPVLFFLSLCLADSLESPARPQRSRHSARQRTVELLGWVGIPRSSAPMSSKSHTGVVGIDEPASGISLSSGHADASLFFGQLYRLPLVLSPHALLTGFCARHGSEHWPTLCCSLRWLPQGHRGHYPFWHDPAGVTFSLFASLLSVFSLRLRNKGL